MKITVSVRDTEIIFISVMFGSQWCVSFSSSDRDIELSNVSITKSERRLFDGGKVMIITFSKWAIYYILGCIWFKHMKGIQPPYPAKNVSLEKSGFSFTFKKKFWKVRHLWTFATIIFLGVNFLCDQIIGISDIVI